MWVRSVLFMGGFKFGFVEEIQDTEIQDTRYRNGSFRKVFCISCIFVSCNLYLTEKLQFLYSPLFIRNCKLYSSAYIPPFAMSCSWSPCSTIRPSAMTAISSAFLMVDRR